MRRLHAQWRGRAKYSAIAENTRGGGGGESEALRRRWTLVLLGASEALGMDIHIMASSTPLSRSMLR